MDTQDVLSLEAQRRSWPIAPEVGERNVGDAGGYLPFNNRMFASTLPRAHREPMRSYASLEDLYNAMKLVVFLYYHGENGAAEEHLEGAALALEAQDWQGRGIERAAAYEYLSEACLAVGSLPRARAAAQIADDEHGRYLDLLDTDAEEAIDDLMTRRGSLWCLLGYVYCLEGDYSEALAHVAAGVAILNAWAREDYQPLEARLLWGLEVYAEVLERVGEYEMARRVLERILRIRLAQLHAVAAPIEAALTATKASLARVFEREAETVVSER